MGIWGSRCLTWEGSGLGSFLCFGWFSFPYLSGQQAGLLSCVPLPPACRPHGCWKNYSLKSAQLIPLLPWLKNLQRFPVMHLSEPRSTPTSSVLLCGSFACMQRFLQTLSVLQASACSFPNVVPSCWEGCLPPGALPQVPSLALQVPGHCRFCDPVLVAAHWQITALTTWHSTDVYILFSHKLFVKRLRICPFIFISVI